MEKIKLKAEYVGSKEIDEEQIRNDRSILEAT